ncbi:hypothetical protein [Planctellipticum variicoloris]|uniref:hypothetical protein n=1 Tax=Planctellipticum variicoloris TaxID=3064265 RepID=UPI003013CE22|nr:hypothetical protein SH412_005303 [Planctomycetaceae bacterium SH412]
MSDSQPEGPSWGGAFTLLPKPMSPFRSLSAHYRWESTRRHPYYLQAWALARRYFLQEPSSSLRELAFREFAVSALGCIGVGRLPADPALEFDQLGSDAAVESWLAGTIHPISCRGLVGMLIAALPKETLAQIGLNLLRGFTGDGELDEMKQAAFLQLAQQNDPSLDGYVDAPILSISPSASLRALRRDLPRALQPWREGTAGEERRDRADNYPAYLQVWDLREGWRNGRYDNAAEMRLRDVAERLHLSRGTVHHRYRRAFELITGHSYSPPVWLRIFGPEKLSGFAEAVGRAAARRPHRSRTPREIPESVVTPARASSGLVHANSMTTGNEAILDFKMDIRDLVNQGLTNEEISLRMELGPQGTAIVQAFRDRFFEE